MTQAAQAPTPFHDLDHFMAVPRVAGLAISPDGQRLVTTVSTLSPDATSFRTALWQVDPEGTQPARRLTRSAKGEAGAAFGGDGTLYFTSARPDPEEEQDEETSALWAIPASGGEAHVVHSRRGGIASVMPARAASTVLVTASVMKGANDEDQDAALRKERKDVKSSAILHSGYPVRYWDHDLGPSTVCAMALEADPEAEDDGKPTTIDHEPARRLRNLTPQDPKRAGGFMGLLSEDGSFVLSVESRRIARGETQASLVRIDVADGSRTQLWEEPELHRYPVAISPDGSQAAVIDRTLGSAEETSYVTLHLMDTRTGQSRELATDWDRRINDCAFLRDGSALIVTADDDGRCPIFRIPLDGGEVTKVTSDDAAYGDLCVAPDDATVYAVRHGIRAVPEVVKVDLASGATTALQGPTTQPEFPGTLEDVECTAEDGSRVRGWLCLPEGTSADKPAPLMLWVHGGPVMSYNGWSWRWAPWIYVAQGYAVLMPDPALSTGYGRDWIQRGWGNWGDKTYGDVMSITDAIEARDDIDGSKTVMLGASFGGYMANWIAGNTDRFAAIVSHASLWALDNFGSSTDMSSFWSRELSPEMALANSPHLKVENINTPMLVIHGDKDYRVPINEGLRLWFELCSKSKLAIDDNGETPHRFLYFPDENHWILKPQNGKTWNNVVSGFVNQHVHGTNPDIPVELGLTQPPATED